MRRRTFLALSGATVLAGCSESSSGFDKSVTNNVPQLEASNIQAEVGETAFGETVVVSGMLENTGNETIDVKIITEFFADDGTSLGTFDEWASSGAADPIEPNTRVGFRTGYEDAQPDQVGGYEVVIGPGYDGSTADSAESQSETSGNGALAVETGQDVAVEDGRATLTGTLSTLGPNNSAACYFQWRPTGKEWTDTTVQTLRSTGRFTAEVTGLAANSTYEYRAIAEAGDAVATGAAVSFGTAAPSISFRDEWEDGDLDAPLWRTSTGGDQASVSVVEEQATDGGDYSLALETYKGDSAEATTDQAFRWDTAWEADGLVKFTEEDIESDVGPPNPTVADTFLAGRQVNVRFNGPDYENDIISASINGGGSGNESQRISHRWTPGMWYGYRLRHEGDGVYKLKFWEATESEPESFEARTTDDPLDSDKYPIALHAYAGRDATTTVSHAFISYQTDGSDGQSDTGSGSGSNQASVFYDYESDTPGNSPTGWRWPSNRFGSLWGVTDTRAYDGTRSGELAGTDKNGFRTLDAPYGRDGLEVTFHYWCASFDDIADHNIILARGNVESGSNKRLLYTKIHDGGVTTEDRTPIAALNDGQWNSITYVLHFDRDAYDVRVNGDSVATDRVFTNSGTEFDTVRHYLGRADSPLYHDGIYIE